MIGISVRSGGRLVRRSFIIALVALFAAAAAGGYWFLVVFAGGDGGQVSISPDGAYQIWVFRYGRLFTVPPYEFLLRRIGKEGEPAVVLRQFKIHRVDGRPSQKLRGAPRVIAWDSASRFADVSFDGEPYFRLHVPETTAAEAPMNSPSLVVPGELDDDSEKSRVLLEQGVNP